MISIPPGEEDRALVTVPHTTGVRGTRFEAAVAVNFLKAGAFDTQGVLTIPSAKLLRSLGRLKSEELGAVELCLREWLDLPASPSDGGT